MNAPFSLAGEFIRRELRSRFAGSVSGGLWAVLQPLVQLAVYSFAFIQIFKVTLPGVDPPGYVAFLAAAMWPWFAFSEALLRSTTVIQENAALIGKVAIPRWILVLASVSASFLVHIVGFAFVLLVLAWLTVDVHLSGLLPALSLFLPLFVLALGFSFLLAAIQVFIRDLAQVAGTVLQLVMFAAPIMYARAAMPEKYQWALDIHPFTFYADAMRSLLLDYGRFDLIHLGYAIAVAGVVLVFGYAVFRRLDPHFEDFL